MSFPEEGRGCPGNADKLPNQHSSRQRLSRSNREPLFGESLDERDCGGLGHVESFESIKPSGSPASMAEVRSSLVGLQEPHGYGGPWRA